ncbi:hypothetical protein GUI12_02080 [Anaplasmataceae bacterium AB001_6]|nr:hypothetical protein GUI12_02080 [Anaplasmataceae bacterium AB001_6]
MNNIFSDKLIYLFIMAAGNSSRMDSCASVIPKQYVFFKDKSVLSYSIDDFSSFTFIDKVFVVTDAKHKIFYDGLKNMHPDIFFVPCGGITRSCSVFNIVNYVNDGAFEKPDFIAIHDAVRFNTSPDLIVNLIKNLYEKNGDAVVPIQGSTDTLVFFDDSDVASKSKPSSIKREKIFRVQTPQIFKYSSLLKIYNSKKNQVNDLYSYTDESSLLIDNGYNVIYIEHKNASFKITYRDDFCLVRGV